MTSSAKEPQLVDHRVDGLLELEDLALGVDRDLLRQVALGHRGGHRGDVAHLVGQVGRHRVHRLGEVLPRAGHARHLGLAAELAVGADLARHAGDLLGEDAQRVGHRVDRLGQRGDLALGVDGDLLGQVALGHRGGDLGDVAHLRRQVRRHEVHVLGEVAPHAGDVAHLGLAAELALGADLARHARDLVGERAQLVDHHVDGLLELEDLALGVHGDLLGQVAVGHRRRDLGDVAHLAGQVGGHEVDVVGEVLPRAGDAGDRGLAAELALGADLARHARDLVGEGAELVDHRVHGGADAGELALERLALDGQRHLLGQVAGGHRDDDARDLGGGADEVVDQAVDRVQGGRPAAVRAVEARALGHAALAADDAAEAHELGRQLGVALDELVVGGFELTHDALAPCRQAMGEVARGGRSHGGLQAAQDLVLVARARRGPVRRRPDLASGGRLAHGAPDSLFGAFRLPLPTGRQTPADNSSRQACPGNATGRAAALVAIEPTSMRQGSVQR